MHQGGQSAHQRDMYTTTNALYVPDTSHALSLFDDGVPADNDSRRIDKGLASTTHVRLSTKHVGRDRQEGIGRQESEQPAVHPGGAVLSPLSLP